ncbi:hypothetical protein IFM89_024249 [Coptis chinensis]|uniref:Glutamyl/glutaminyl-tRNA synthetase class Ib catalytic domain-containing protein n=1 Tax=Coptis chinensis TaxID=261450 RepID=A0A835H8L2_9MAGN|nr:hypothetical protein IFM89_024249 [Coptis chinensis]
MDEAASSAATARKVCFIFATSEFHYKANAKEMTHFCLLQMQRSKRGKFILQIEDTYLDRSTKESKNAVLQHLSWLGLDWDWDEGPGIGGDYGPYRQFGRNSLYNHYAKKLLDSGHVYRCFCSNEINIDPESLKPKLPSKKDLKPYPSTCYLEYKGHKGTVMSISVQVSGQWLAYGSSDGTVRVWEVETGRCVRIWKVGEAVHYVAWNPISELRILAASIESLIKVPEPPILPFYKPVDYVEVLAQIHEELESYPHERSNLYLLQFQVFRGLEEVKLLQRSLLLAWQKASTIHEKIVFGAWLKYEKLGVWANRHCLIASHWLKDACDRTLSSFVTSREEVVDLMEYALAENSNAASCLQVFLHDLPNCLSDDRVVRIFRDANRQHRAIMVGFASFSLYCLLSEVVARDPCSDITAYFLEQLVESSVSGHVYSVASLARLDFIKGWKQRSCDKLSSVISSFNPLGWMYQERALYCEGEKKCDNLDKATELDPTFNYLYMYRAACLMRKQSVEAALAEINRALGFKLALECLELRFCFYLALEDYRAALCDVQAILAFLTATAAHFIVGEDIGLHRRFWNHPPCLWNGVFAADNDLEIVFLDKDLLDQTKNFGAIGVHLQLASSALLTDGVYGVSVNIILEAIEYN